MQNNCQGANKKQFGGVDQLGAVSLEIGAGSGAGQVVLLQAGADGRRPPRTPAQTGLHLSAAPEPRQLNPREPKQVCGKLLQRIDTVSVLQLHAPRPMPTSRRHLPEMSRLPDESRTAN